MLKFKSIFLIIFFLSAWHVHAQQKYPTLIRSSLEDEIIILSVDKPVYFPGDTVSIKVQRNDNTATTLATPILIIEGTTLSSIDNNNIYRAVIPQACAPGLYRVRLRVKDPQGRHYIYETDCIVNVEEHQVIEQISRYVSIEPKAGGEDLQSIVTLDRNQIRNLRVIFQRDSI